MENRYDPFLLALAALVFVLGLGGSSIWDANEAFYVDTPRQMIQSGDYVTPTFNGQNRLNKPVLSYWIVAGFYQLFGVSVTTERVAITIGALGIVFAAFLIGRALGSPATGVIAALLVATAPRFIHFARRNMIDIYLTLFMALALAAFVLAMSRPEHRRRFLLLMYVAIGLGVLTKGPVAVVLPAAILLTWLFVERRLADLRHMMLVPGALIVLAIVVPWYAAIHARHGWDPIWAFFVGENVGRFASTMTTDRSFGFFAGVLFGDILLPWAPLLLVPFWTGWSNIVGAWRGPAQPPATDASIRRLLWLWIVVIVGAFSFSASKEDLYILPVAPAAAALIADALVASGFGRHHRGVRTILAMVCVLVAALGGAVLWILGSGYYRITDAPLVAAILIAGGFGGLALVLARRPDAAFRTLATAFVVFNVLFVLRVLPGLEPLKPVPVLAATLASRASPGAPVAFHNLVLPSLVYYLGRPVVELPGDDAAVRFVNEHPQPWVVTGDEEWNRLRERVPGLCIAVRHPRFDARLPDLLRRAPPPDVLLVTKCKDGVVPRSVENSGDSFGRDVP